MLIMLLEPWKSMHLKLHSQRQVNLLRVYFQRNNFDHLNFKFLNVILIKILYPHKKVLVFHQQEVEAYFLLLHLCRMAVFQMRAT